MAQLSDVNDFSNYSRMLRSMDTDDRIMGSGTSIEDSWSDYMTYGVASAGVSAVVGLLNTGIAFGEVIGVAGKNSYIDEVGAVASFLGDDAAGFYDRHKTGVDALGFVAGSLVPGLGAVKALRAAQTAGRISAAGRASTGLRNPDLVLGSEAVETAKRIAVEQTTIAPNWFSPHMIRGYAQGAKQNVMEAAVFEGAVLATMNQHATLNPDDLGYLDAMTDQFWDATKFGLFGAALGTGIDAFRIAGAVRRHGNEEWTRTANLENTAALLGNEFSSQGVGARLVDLSNAFKVHAERAKGIDPSDSLARRRAEAGYQQLRTELLKTIEEANGAGEHGFKMMSKLVEDFGYENMDQLTSAISTLRRVDLISKSDMAKMENFYEKTRSPTSIFELDTGYQYAGAQSARHREFVDALNQVVAKDGRRFATNEIDIDKYSANAHRGQPQGQATVPDGIINSTILDGSVIAVDETDFIFVPRNVLTNHKSIASSYEINKTLADRGLIKSLPSFAEYKAQVLFHELGHQKSNPAKLTASIDNIGVQIRTAMRDTKGSYEKVIASEELGSLVTTLEELIDVSREMRPGHWTGVLFEGGFSTGTKSANIVRYMLDPATTNLKKPPTMEYLMKATELLADGAAAMTNPRTREVMAKKFPRLAKMFNEEGALSQAWSPTKAYFNSRTKEVQASVLPRLNDVDTGMKLVISSGTPTLKTSLGNFKRDTTTFSNESLEAAMSTKADFRAWEAQWHIAARMDVAQILGKTGEVKIAGSDLPLLERVVQLLEEGNPEIRMAFQQGRITFDNNPLPHFVAKDILVDKKDVALKLLLQSRVGYNEQQIARMLNVDIDHAIGKLDAPKDTLIMMGKQSYTEPENFVMRYDARTLKDYQGAVMNITGNSMMQDAITSANKAYAAEVLGEFQTLLPEGTELLSRVESVNPWNSRAGMLNNMRSEMGSLREIAQYVGKLFRQEVTNRAAEIDSSFVKHASKFNAREASVLRAELATVTNIFRREHYYLGRSADGSYVAVRKDKTLEIFERQKLEFNPQYLQQMTPEVIEMLGAAGDNFAPGMLRLSQEVGDLMSEHIAANSRFVDLKQTLAKAAGKSTTLDGNILYMPPKDLSREKYHAFVVPRAAYGETDGRMFMIYAENEQQYNSKMRAIQERYGDRYQIVTSKERDQYAKAKGDYDQGLSFDEIDFDTTLENRGRASELMPNLDVSLSGTLDSFRTWRIRQEEALLRAGMERHYHGTFDMLKRQDEYYSNVERSTNDKTWQEPATIYRDTIATMLGIRARGSNIETLWSRVNDFAGEKGSQIIERAISSVFGTAKSGSYSQKDFDAFNAQMAEAGYISPFDNIAQVLASSPDTVKSTAFPALVKTLSNLFSTLQLRLDQANSILQTISTPILALPVLREAQEALAGTPAGAKLTAMTHVRNPATGDLEPTPMKLLMRATKEFFSEDGKAFMERLKEHGVITDHLSQYLRATDMTQLNGRHAMSAINNKIDDISNKASKFTGYNLSENFSRFIVAHAIKDIGEVRGLPEKEMWAMISGAVDKVHGVYAGAQRPQVFQGVLGQAVGLYQTYFFNLTQNMLKYVADGQTRQALTMMGMQGSIFGVQSFPGFQTLNTMIGETNRNNEDFYTLTNADDPNSNAVYAMYGLGSHIFGFPVDFAGRGSLETRHSLVLPTTLQDIPIVSQLARAYGNATRTVSAALEDNANVGMALMHGMAHNGLNRPLQGIGTIMMGGVFTGTGQVNWANANRVNYDVSEDLNWGSMFARAIGTRPLNEAIVQSSYFRKAAYQANARASIAEVGARLQFNASAGTLQPQDYGSFAVDYESAGGELQNFNAYWSRQLKMAGTGQMMEFQNELMKDRNSSLGRSVRRMEIAQSSQLPWAYPVTDPATLEQ